jgi:acetyl esterase
MWMLGDLDTHDRLCRLTAAGAGVEVLAVDYRCAPEHRWPAAVDDACVAVRYAADHLSDLVAVEGDSAGGCVAALSALALREAGDAGLLCAQVVVCPNTDLTGCHRSMVDKGTGHGLEAADVRWAAAQWMPDVARHADGDASPLRADDLSGPPSSVVVTAEHEPGSQRRTTGTPSAASREARPDIGGRGRRAPTLHRRHSPQPAASMTRIASRAMR